MENLISIAQIQKQLRMNGKKVPSKQAIYHIITKYGCKPMANRPGYYNRYAKTLLDKHIGGALKFDQDKIDAKAKMANMQQNKSDEGSNGTSDSDTGSESGSNPDTSLNQDKQSGGEQQSGDTWAKDNKTFSTWWIWPLAALTCGGAWFLIWKRREDEEDEQGNDFS